MADISAPVRAFITEHIFSVLQLEVILLLRLSPDRWWSLDAMNAELRAEAGWLRNVLEDLCTRGLAEKSTDAVPLFRYCPRTQELGQVLDALAQDYLVQRVRVTELIYTKPPDAIRAFAKAFDLRKGGGNG